MTMGDFERKGYEPPPEPPPEAPREASSEPAPREHALDVADGRARGEVAVERRATKERIAELLWQRPKQFVSHVLARGLSGPLKRFLAVFGGLGDDTMLTDDLKKLRAQAQQAADDVKNDD
jgi:hypothetical protein